eukprot:SM000281S10755  [mRNA]  locus=s281:120860:127278:- [translate_table: standard]
MRGGPGEGKARTIPLNAALAVFLLLAIIIAVQTLLPLDLVCEALVEEVKRQFRPCGDGSVLTVEPSPVAADSGQSSPPQQSGSIDLSGTPDVEELKRALAQKVEELDDAKKKIGRLVDEKVALEIRRDGSVAGIGQADDAEVLKIAKRAVEECGQGAHVSTGAMGLKNSNVTVWKGYACAATDEEIHRYLTYEPRKLCPDDWMFVQELIFKRNCFALPKRRCLSRTPPKFSTTVPFPESLFSQKALADENVRWDDHQCKSFDCLNTRSIGDCRNCFNLSLEERRWKNRYRGSLKMEEVIEMKAGSLRLGLDAGGGTGSFAAHMARYNVTVMTTAMNIETVKFRDHGLPYMETIALRGLVPLHVPHKARLPFFDGTLDIIHSVNSIKYLLLLDFEELIFEWDRVLRPGGIMWFEMFYAPENDMPLYEEEIKLLGYKQLYWNKSLKPDKGEREGRQGAPSGSRVGLDDQLFEAQAWDVGGRNRTVGAHRPGRSCCSGGSDRQVVCAPSGHRAVVDQAWERVWRLPRQGKANGEGQHREPDARGPAGARGIRGALSGSSTEPDQEFDAACGARMVLLKLKQLESQLQAVQPFRHPKVDLEQYPTSAHIAARMVHMMESLYNDVEGKVVVDLGCGYVIGVDVDSDALLTCSENCTDLEVQMDLLQCPISSIALQGPVDTVVMNPPFGTRRKGADMEFLQSALKLRFDLAASFAFHKSRQVDVAVDLWRFTVVRSWPGEPVEEGRSEDEKRVP